jgi:hypothetical protein
MTCLRAVDPRRVSRALRNQAMLQPRPAGITAGGLLVMFPDGVPAATNQEAAGRLGPSSMFKSPVHATAGKAGRYRESLTSRDRPMRTHQLLLRSSIEEPSMTSMDQRPSSRPPSTATHRHMRIGRPIGPRTTAPRRAAAPAPQRVDGTPGTRASRASALRRNRMVGFADIAHLHFRHLRQAGERGIVSYRKPTTPTRPCVPRSIPISSGGVVLVIVTRSSPP